MHQVLLELGAVAVTVVVLGVLGAVQFAVAGVVLGRTVMYTASFESKHASWVFTGDMNGLGQHPRLKLRGSVVWIPVADI